MKEHSEGMSAALETSVEAPEQEALPEQEAERTTEAGENEAPQEDQPRAAASPDALDAPIYSLRQVMEIVQKETDRRVSAALQKQRKAFERKMPPPQQAEKAANEIARRDKTISEMGTKITEMCIISNRGKLAEKAAASGVPAELIDVIDVGEDYNAAEKRLDELARLFNRSVKKAAESRLNGTEAHRKQRSGIPGKGR